MYPQIPVMSFLRECVDEGHAPSMLKFYVAAMSAFHSRTDGWPVSRNDLVVKPTWREMAKPSSPVYNPHLGSGFSFESPDVFAIQASPVSFAKSTHFQDGAFTHTCNS